MALAETTSLVELFENVSRLLFALDERHREHNSMTDTELSELFKPLVDEAIAEVGADDGILAMDGILVRSRLEDEVLRVIGSTGRFYRLYIPPQHDEAEMHEVVDMIKQTAFAMGDHLVQIEVNIELTVEATEEIFFQIIDRCSSLMSVSIYIRCISDQVAHVLSRFLQLTTSVSEVTLTWETSPLLDEPCEEPIISQQALDSIFAGITRSTEVDTVHIAIAPTNEEKSLALARSMTAAVQKSNILVRFKVGEPYGRLVQQIKNELFNTEASKSLELVFRETSPTDLSPVFMMDFSTPVLWHSLLPEEVPLGLWPSILNLTNDWAPPGHILEGDSLQDPEYQRTSHGPVDALYFLVKQKPDVLLQNVRCRKRKRPSFFSPGEYTKRRTSSRS